MMQVYCIVKTDFGTKKWGLKPHSISPGDPDETRTRNFRRDRPVL